MSQGTPGDRFPTWLLPGALLVVSVAFRAGYIHAMDLPIFDPWRHLVLIRNLREGLGFTLFDGQPYVWYSPVWYRIAAFLPARVPLEWFTAALSALSAPLTYLLLLHGSPRLPRPHAAVGGLLMAVSGPVVAFTCHFGPEALALLLTLSGLLLCALSPRTGAAFAGGLLFGVALVLRLNFVFNALLFLPLIRGRSRVAGLISGVSLPLALSWWRNQRILDSHSWVFTWDGLAVRTEEFNWFSTLVVQLHPSVGEALRRLHEQVVAWPEWLHGPGGIAWGTIVFMLAGIACVAASRRIELIVTAAATLGYFLVLDRGMSSNFFRIYLPLFPVMFLAVAHVSARLFRSGARSAAPVVAATVAAIALGGAGLLVPGKASLELVTPPAGMLTADAYMVNSSFYHPESLIYRFPEKRFIGLPLDPERFDEFRESFPDYRRVLWHELGVQDELAAYLEHDPRFTPTTSRVNGYGRRYVVIEIEGATPPASP